MPKMNRKAAAQPRDRSRDENRPVKRMNRNGTGRFSFYGMPGHIVFILSYAFYVFIFAKSGEPFIYPVYLAPVIIYMFLLLAALGIKSVTGEKMMKVFSKLSYTLCIFAALLVTPLFIKMNIPEPHNFILRKLELILGMSYIFFIAAIAAAVIYRLRDIIKAGNNKIVRYIVIFFFVFYGAVSLWFNYANQPTGDEPEYLITAHSIVYDRDLDLKNNFENRDYTRFYKNKELKPQRYDINRNGKLYTYHPLGLSFIISPFYLLAGRLGVTLFTDLLAALSAGMIFLLLNRMKSNTKDNFKVVMVSGFFVPLIMFSNMIATEIITLAAVLAAYILIIYEHKKIVFPAVIISVLPWLHIRNMPLWLSLAAILIYYNRRNLRNVIGFCAIQAVSGGVLILLNMSVYGSIIPKYSDPGQTAAARFIFENYKAIAGLLFDQEFGILFYTPLFLLFPAGYYILFRNNKRFFTELMVLLIPYIFLITSFDHWWGGGGAWPRFLVPVLFMFVVPAAWLYYGMKNKLSKILYRIMVVWGFAVSFLISLIPWFRWNKGHGDNWIPGFISKIINIDITGIFPSLHPGGRINILSFTAWLAVMLAVNAYMIIETEKNTK